MNRRYAIGTESDADISLFGIAGKWSLTDVNTRVGLLATSRRNITSGRNRNGRWEKEER